jgi:DMSO reductase anchor subunit
MWRRSWLSREVLLFGLFFSTLFALTAISWLNALHQDPAVALALLALKVIAPTLGGAGIVASAYIYLVPARPAWNMPHTPMDFILSAAVLGSAAAPVLISATTSIHAFHAFTFSPASMSFPLWPLIFTSALWGLNRIVRTIRLHKSSVYERRAAASLLNTPELRGIFLVSFALIGLAILLSLAGTPTLALPAALAGVISSRYLFFVSVVPLNMALTFVRSVHA